MRGRRQYIHACSVGSRRCILGWFRHADTLVSTAANVLMNCHQRPALQYSLFLFEHLNRTVWTSGTYWRAWPNRRSDHWPHRYARNLYSMHASHPAFVLPQPFIDAHIRKAQGRFRFLACPCPCPWLPAACQQHLFVGHHHACMQQALRIYSLLIVPILSYYLPLPANDSLVIPTQLPNPSAN
jgi:hypothetical protein